MKKHGHYCKVCGEYKANEKFSGKGHAAHICKACAALPPEVRAEQMAINRLVNLPWRLSKEQLSWLKNRAKDKRPEVRELAQEQLEMRFPSRQEQEDFEDDSEFFLDEDDITKQPAGFGWLFCYSLCSNTALIIASASACLLGEVTFQSASISRMVLISFSSNSSCRR